MSAGVRAGSLEKVDTRIADSVKKDGVWPGKSMRYLKEGALRLGAIRES